MRSTSRATAAPTAACENVKPWVNPAPGAVTVSNTDPDAATNPNGQYPDVAPLAATTMSARAPQWSSPNQRPVRPKPVMTSSATSSTPCRRQTSAMAGQ